MKMNFLNKFGTGGVTPYTVRFSILLPLRSANGNIQNVSCSGSHVTIKYLAWLVKILASERAEFFFFLMWSLWAAAVQDFCRPIQFKYFNLLFEIWHDVLKRKFCAISMKWNSNACKSYFTSVRKKKKGMISQLNGKNRPTLKEFHKCNLKWNQCSKNVKQH